MEIQDSFVFSKFEAITIVSHHKMRVTHESRFSPWKSSGADSDSQKTLFELVKLENIKTKLGTTATEESKVRGSNFLTFAVIEL